MNFSLQMPRGLEVATDFRKQSMVVLFPRISFGKEVIDTMIPRMMGLKISILIISILRAISPKMEFVTNFASKILTLVKMSKYQFIIIS